MAQAILMPKLGQTVEEAAIVKWIAKEGDAVKKGDVLFEIETDKAVLEAESFYDGVLLKIFVGVGETVPVSSTVAFIGEAGEKVPDMPKPAAKPAAKPAPQKETTKAVCKEPEVGRALRSEPQQPVAVVPAGPALPSRLFISPRAKAVTKEKLVNPENITGSGPNGRIVVKDVEAYLDANNYAQLKISATAKKLAAKEEIDIVKVRGTGAKGKIGVEDIERAIAEKPKKMSKMREIIAQRLTQSFTTTPHFYVTVGVDMTDLFAYRQDLKSQGKAFTVTDFILKAVILSLKELPIVNSVCDGNKVRWYGTVDLGLAVSVSDGLVVPAIRNAEDLGMMELHDTAKDLGTRAREGKLMPDEMTGTTFTVSNMGMLGVDEFHAIINPGEGAILAVASTKEKPVVKDGEIKIRSIMNITASVDHRIVDGAMAAEFVNAIKQKLEDLELWKSLT